LIVPLVKKTFWPIAKFAIFVNINKVIAPDKSQIYFFEKQKDSLDTVLRPINIDKDGKLSDWPKSFFDEWDNLDC
jgi:predicted ATPase